MLNLYKKYKIIYIPKGEFINSLKCMLNFLLFLSKMWPGNCMYLLFVILQHIVLKVYVLIIKIQYMV